MLGVPEEHLDKLVELGDRMLVPTDPELTPPTTLTPEESKYLPFGSEAGAELLELGRPLIQERKGHPCGDVLSILANAEIGGCPVSQHDLDNNLAILVVAGNETTRQGMALGMLALMEHPDQLELLRSDPSLMPSAVDELIRYASPVWHFRRTAVADTELRGVQDPGGRAGRRLVRRGQPRPRGVPRPAPARPHPQARRARRVRPRRPALLPRRAPRPARDGGAVRAAAATARLDRADRPAGAPALELHQRPQAPAGARRRSSLTRPTGW